MLVRKSRKLSRPTQRLRMTLWKNVCPTLALKSRNAIETPRIGP